MVSISTVLYNVWTLKVCVKANINYLYVLCWFFRTQNENEHLEIPFQEDIGSYANMKNSQRYRFQTVKTWVVFVKTWAVFYRLWGIVFTHGVRLARCLVGRGNILSGLYLRKYKG